MSALLFWNLAVWVVVAGLRFGDDVDLAIGLPATAWPMAAGVSVGLAALSLRRAILAGEAPWRGADRRALWILCGLGPLAFWIAGDRVATTGPEVVLAIVLAVVGLERVVAHRARIFAATTWFATGGRAGRALALGTVVVLGVVAVLARANPDAESSDTKWAFALSTYPLYAMVQLGAVMVLPIAVWSRRGERSPVAIVAGVALLFALVHAPNPVVMSLTGAGMVAWAIAHRHGVGFAWLALSMGLCGAAIAQGVPQDLTQNLRVNAGYVLARQTERAVERYDARVERLASDDAFVDAGGTLRAWLGMLHEEGFGTPPSDRVLDDWSARVRNANRDRIVRMFLDSAEFRRRHGVGALMDGRDRSLLFSTFEPTHPAHAAYERLRSREPDRAPETAFDAFLVELYRVLLQRVPSTDEILGWSPVPPARDRVEVVRVALAQAGIEDPAPWRRPAEGPRWARP